VKNAINALHDNVNSLNTSVMSMSSQLKDTKTDTQNLIELTKRLQLERYILGNSQKLNIISLICLYLEKVYPTNNYWQMHM
jgi:regulator of replication initiation timing